MFQQTSRLKFTRWISVTIVCLLIPLSHVRADDVDEPQLPDEEIGNTDVDLLTSDDLTRGIAIQSLGWAIPTYTAKEARAILSQYAILDPHKQLPKNVLRKAILYFHRNRDLIPNKNYMAIVDFSKHSRTPRFFLIDFARSTFQILRVAHGLRSDRNNDGYAESFSNLVSSDKSSLGFFVTGEVYTGKHGRSLRIDGLSVTNSNVRQRAVVIHGAAYVKDQAIKPGRSLGCFALSMESKDFVIDALQGGALIYSGRSRFD